MDNGLSKEGIKIGTIMSLVSSRVSQNLFITPNFYLIYLFLYSQWKALTPTELEPYEEMARKDRERYEKEKAVRSLEIKKLKKVSNLFLHQIRDEECFILQEEKRKQNALTETDTRMRGSTVIYE